jgi:Protein of unknown function (DUF3987)
MTRHDLGQWPFADDHDHATVGQTGPNIDDFADVFPWSEPARLTADSDLPSFPVEAFPDWLAQYIKAEATATQTPTDMPGMMALAALAAAAGGLARIQVRPGWQEPTNLYVVVLMAPGSRKTQVVGDGIRPLVRFDQDEAKRLAAIILQETTSKRIAERAADQPQTGPADQQQASVGAWWLAAHQRRDGDGR